MVGPGLERPKASGWNKVMAKMKRNSLVRMISLGCLLPLSTGCPLGNGGNGDNGGIEPGVEITIPDEGNEHVPVGQQVTYVANPPASGSHWSQGGVAPAPAGFYETTVEEEQWVHNLEHGHIVILYDCGGACSAQLLADLQDLFDAAPPSPIFGTTKLVIAPYDGLPFLLMAIAWDTQLSLAAYDETALLDFYTRHLDQGPELAP